MAFNHSITFVGNLTRDPVTKTSPSGVNRALLGLAINEGTGDNEKVSFVNITAFGDLGDHVAASASRGTRLIVKARLDQYQIPVTRDGEDTNVTLTNFVAEDIGIDLRWATAKVSRVGGNGSSRSSSHGEDEGFDDEDDEVEEQPKPKAKAKSKPKAKPRPKPVEDDEDDEF